MAHHGSIPPDIAKEMGLGATGEFPQGKITEDDEGEIKLAVYHRENKVIMDFGKSTAWIGFDAQQAGELASTLIKHAREIASGPVSIEL